MRSIPRYALTLAALLTFSGAAAQQMLPTSLAVQAEGAAYADVADLVIISPMIADITIRNTKNISAEQAIGVPPTLQRMLVEADVTALIRGESDIALRVNFLHDVPKDAKGKGPKLKKQRFFVLGKQVPNRPGEIRLSRPNALIQWSASNDRLVRTVAQEALDIGAPPAITGISSAFFSPGTVIGDGETQIFIDTANKAPMSLSIMTRAGQAKRWSVSTSELIDESGTVPRMNTLLWYRLACGLPRSLSSDLVESSGDESAARAQGDYNFVLQSLGPCVRRR